MNEITNISEWFSWFFSSENIKNIFTYNEGEPLIFTGFYFWAFFAIVLVFYSIVHKKRGLRNAYLFIVSLFFYYKTSGLFISILLFSTISDYIIGHLIYYSKKKVYKKIFVAVSVIINLFVLCYFKYAYFFTDSFNAFFETNYEVFNHFAQWTNEYVDTHFTVNKILLPVGISFYTFQTISYTIDIYRGQLKPSNSLREFAIFVSFFPQIVAGPILRAKDFLDLQEIIKKLKENNIKIILFTTPQHKYFYDLVDTSEKIAFEKILLEIHNTSNLEIHSFTEKYSDLEIWRNPTHIVVSKSASIFSDDIAKLILEELK